MSEPKDKLSNLEERIRAAQTEQERAPSLAKAKAQAMSDAYRMVTELLACTIVGLFIGYWLDEAFGTRPWLMIVFFFLGVASGLWTLYKLAGKQE